MKLKVLTTRNKLLLGILALLVILPSALYLSDSLGYFNLNQNKTSYVLSNSNATPEAKKLMMYLVNQEGKGILSGQQDLSGAQWLKDHVGKYPAVVGFDLYDYTAASKVAHGERSSQVEHAIEWHQKGGIVTFAWHWVAPTMYDDPKWRSGFYTKNTDFDVEYALNHPESVEYALLLKDIDLVAQQLKRLQDADVPVLFRPLHEAEGSWFWWGAIGPEPTKKLWRLLYDELTNKYKLNNLIWVWNSSSPKWYPGDQYVDIVSYDSYPKAGDKGAKTDQFEELKKLVRNKKLVAMSENGTIPDPQELKSKQVNWSWFMTWRDEFLKGGKHNSLGYLKKVYHDPYVVTLDKLKLDLRE